MNLTGLNTKKDSGVASVRAIGIDYDISDRNVKYKKKKEKRPVVRFNLNIKTKKLIPKKKCVELKEAEPTTNHCVYSKRKNGKNSPQLKSVMNFYGKPPKIIHHISPKTMV
jgi:hypothetical protein